MFLSAYEVEQDINSISSSIYANALSCVCNFSLLTFTNTLWKAGCVCSSSRHTPGSWNEGESPYNTLSGKQALWQMCIQEKWEYKVRWVTQPFVLMMHKELFIMLVNISLFKCKIFFCILILVSFPEEYSYPLVNSRYTTITESRNAICCLVLMPHSRGLISSLDCGEDLMLLNFCGLFTPWSQMAVTVVTQESYEPQYSQNQELVGSPNSVWNLIPRTFLMSELRGLSLSSSLFSFFTLPPPFVCTAVCNIIYPLKRNSLKVCTVIPICMIHWISPLSMRAGFLPHLWVWPFRAGKHFAFRYVWCIVQASMF